MHDVFTSVPNAECRIIVSTRTKRVRVVENIYLNEKLHLDRAKYVREMIRSVFSVLVSFLSLESI